MNEFPVKESWLDAASKHELERVISKINVKLNERFPRVDGSPKYGRLCRHLSAAQLQAFFNSIPPHYVRERFFFYTCYLFGLRAGEALQINSDDVDMITGTLTIHSEKANGKDRFLPIPMAWVPDYDFIQEKYAHLIRGKQGFIFFSDRKDKLVWGSCYVRRIFRTVCEMPACRDVGLPKTYGKTRDGRPMHLYTAHSLRHSCGKIICDRYGARKAADYLGHASLDSTMIYTKTTVNELRECGESLGAGLAAVK